MAESNLLPTCVAYSPTPLTCELHVLCYSSGAITTSGNMTFTLDSDLNGASPQFTLTCISTGGPATTVTWTRDSVTVTEGTQTTQFNGDNSDPQYTHNFTLTGGSGMGGLYTCTVANDRPSGASVQLIVQGMQWKCTVVL